MEVLRLAFTSKSASSLMPKKTSRSTFVQLSRKAIPCFLSRQRIPNATAVTVFGRVRMFTICFENDMRVKEKPISSYPWYLRPFFWNQKRKYGQVLKPALIWARVPCLFTAIAILYGVLDRKNSPIDPVLRSLITVRVSQINECRFCIDINSAMLAKRTSSMNKVEALEQWQDSELFDNKERVVQIGRAHV